MGWLVGYTKRREIIVKTGYKIKLPKKRYTQKFKCFFSFWFEGKRRILYLVDGRGGMDDGRNVNENEGFDT